MSATVPEIEQSFREIAQMLKSRCSLDKFSKNKSFLATKVNKKEILFDILFSEQSKMDPEVRYNLAVYVLEFIEGEAGPFASIEAFRAVEGKAHHFIGARFANKKDYEINTYTDFLTIRENAMQTHISSENYPLIVPLLFKRLCFTKEGFSYLAVVGNLSAVISDLKKLDNYTEKHCTEGEFILKNVRQETGIDISDESDSVKKSKKLREQRLFYITQKIGWQYCYSHIKIGDIRIYIYQDVQEQKIYVPYIGGHLSTALFKC